jgi:type II secretion system protein N
MSNEQSRLRRIFSKAGWIGLTLFLLAIFTVFKLPEAKLKAYIQGSISSALAPRGITFISEKADITLGFGITYRMSNVTISPPPPAQQIKVEQIELSPSILSLIVGRFGGNFWIGQKDGRLQGSFSMKKTDLSASMKAKNFDLGKAGVLAIAAKIQGTGILNGELSVSGNTEIPSSWSGAVNLDLDKIIVEQQTISGFSVPRLSAGKGKIELAIGQGKVQIKTVKLGQQGPDDLFANFTGQLMLGKQWESSTSNVRARFGFGEKVLKAFGLLDAILAKGKQADGTFVYDISGPLFAPMYTPVTTP